jgi:cAMP-binding proteins - catabolite gene activator and regulatory subunit of cAMP-dependent protein kinases
VAVTPIIPFNAIPLLAGIRPADREALEPLCQMRRFEKGQAIFHEAEPAERIHFVVAGRVKIVKAVGAREIILEILGPGEPVGVVAVFERRAFPAGAVVMEESTILSIPEREFFQLLESRPEMTRHVLSGMTMRLMTMNKRLADMTGSVEVRASRLFVTLSERLGVPRDKQIFIPLALSRQELADLLGTTLETTIRLMSRWQKESLVLTEHGGFIIPDVQALRALEP